MALSPVLQLTLAFDSRRDYGRGGWRARLQQDVGAALSTVVEGQSKSALGALLPILSELPAWETVTDEQLNTLTGDCLVMNGETGWSLNLWNRGEQWGSVVENELGHQIGMGSWNHPVEALIRGLDRAVASRARWI